MAKFKVGDKIVMTHGPRKGGTVEEILADGSYMIRFSDGRTTVGTDQIIAPASQFRDLAKEAFKNSSRACNGVRSRNAVVQKALNACGTARNASKSKVKITIKSLTDKGSQTFEKTIDADSLETWMRSAGIEGEYQRVLKQLATEGVQSVPLSVPIRISITSL